MTEAKKGKVITEKDLAEKEQVLILLNKLVPVTNTRTKDLVEEVERLYALREKLPYRIKLNPAVKLAFYKVYCLVEGVVKEPTFAENTIETINTEIKELDKIIVKTQERQARKISRPPTKLPEAFLAPPPPPAQLVVEVKPVAEKITKDIEEEFAKLKTELEKPSVRRHVDRTVFLPKGITRETFEKLSLPRKFELARQVWSVLDPAARNYWSAEFSPEEQRRVVQEFEKLVERARVGPPLLSIKPFKEALTAAARKQEEAAKKADEARMLRIEARIKKAGGLEKLRHKLGLTQIPVRLLLAKPREAVWLSRELRRIQRLKKARILSKEWRFRRLLEQAVRMKARALTGRLPTLSERAKLENKIIKHLKTVRR